MAPGNSSSFGPRFESVCAHQEYKSRADARLFRLCGLGAHCGPANTSPPLRLMRIRP